MSYEEVHAGIYRAQMFVLNGIWVQGLDLVFRVKGLMGGGTVFQGLGLGVLA